MSFHATIAKLAEIAGFVMLTLVAVSLVLAAGIENIGELVAAHGGWGRVVSMHVEAVLFGYLLVYYGQSESSKMKSV